MLFCVVDFILAKERVSGDDSSVNISGKVLSSHEIFCDALAELVVEKFQADLVCLLERFIKVLRTIAYGLGNNVEVLRILWFEAAVSASYSVHYGLSWLNFLRLELLLRFRYFSLAFLNKLDAVTWAHIYILLKYGSHPNCCGY